MTHLQDIARVEEILDGPAPAKSHNIRQLEYTTDLLTRLAALQDEVTRLRDALADSELHCAALQRQLRMLTDGDAELAAC